LVELLKPITGKAGKYIWYDIKYLPYCIVCKKFINGNHVHSREKRLNIARRHAKMHEKDDIASLD